VVASKQETPMPDPNLIIDPDGHRLRAFAPAAS
jgi:hypothetical protein